MPLDTHMYTAEELLPENLNFPVEYEATKVSDKKYVINGDTGEYIGVVGDSFNCASHDDFFQGVQHTMCENLSEHEMSGAKVTWRNARHEAWALMDVTLPNVTSKIVTPKHETEVAQRIIALHGIDGSCSNMVFFGAIDFFCTNGMIRGEHDKLRRKNTSGFSLDRFITQLGKSNDDFTNYHQQMQRWANTPVHVGNVKAMLESLLKSDRTADKMLTLYNQEAGVRGENAWALYSAFTNYASYADERNGFKLRNTGGDTQEKRLFMREVEVAGWVDSPVFKSLEVAA